MFDHTNTYSVYVARTYSCDDDVHATSKEFPCNDYLYFANQKAADNIHTHTDKSRQNTNSDLKPK